MTGSPRLVPWAGLHADHRIGLKPAVDAHRLHQVEFLAGSKRIVRFDPLNLGVSYDDSLQAVGDVKQRVVPVGRPLAAIDKPVLHDHGIAPAGRTRGERHDNAEEDRVTEHFDATIRRHGRFPPARAVACRAGKDVKQGKALAFHPLPKLGKEKRLSVGFVRGDPRASQRLL